MKIINTWKKALNEIKEAFVNGYKKAYVSRYEKIMKKYNQY